MIHDSSNFRLLPAIDPDNCEDNFVGTIRYTNYNGFVETKNNSFNLSMEINKKFNGNNANKVVNRKPINYHYQIVPSSSAGNLKIVLLLESPSNTEFHNVYNINAPAMGYTGIKINKWFISALNRSIFFINYSFCSNGNTFDIYLVNAIRYECNLGFNNLKKQRNHFFKFLWGDSNLAFNQDLYDRLSLINPDLLINCCTAKLKQLCSNKNIHSNISCRSYLNGYHPSRWNANTMFKP